MDIGPFMGTTATIGAAGTVGSSHGNAGTSARSLYAAAARSLANRLLSANSAPRRKCTCPGTSVEPARDSRIVVIWVLISASGQASAPPYTCDVYKPGQTYRPRGFSERHQASSARNRFCSPFTSQ